MLVLLPPSETKVAGGFSPALDASRLKLSSLTAVRERVIDALVALSEDPATAARVLKLSKRQLGEVDVNAAIRTSPTMPAVDRYTGVLFDALDAQGLPTAARSWLAEHVMIHSAPFGPVGAADLIPAYRLGAEIRVPGIESLKAEWSEPVTSAIAELERPLVLDLRSEAYAALGPIGDETDSVFVRVVTEGEDGALRALNHFNKHAKGELVRLLALSSPRIETRDDLAQWSREAGIRLEPSDGEWRLFASGVPGKQMISPAEFG